MKKIILLLVCFHIQAAYSGQKNEKVIATQVEEVTVFLEGAQVTRNKSIYLEGGETLLRFTELSPFIDARSIQVKADGDALVLSVNHHQNFLSQPAKSAELNRMEERLEDINDQIRLENTRKSILQEELSFLRENRVIGGRNQEVSVGTLKEAADFYSQKLTSLKIGEIEIDKQLTELQKERRKINNQIHNLTSKREYPSGEVWVRVDKETPGMSHFEVSYLVANAGWYPSYDIRVQSIDDPVQLVYKANVRQDTKEDWEDVKLSFSTAEPNVSGVAPVLQTYYLDFHSLPPAYGDRIERVSGRVYDSSGESLPGVSVQVKGSTVGTSTDIDGNYSLTLPANASHLTFSFIGFETATLPVNRSVLNVRMEESVVALQEVVVTGYAADREEFMDKPVRKMTPITRIEEDAGIRGEADRSLPMQQVESQTVVDFEISIPFSVKSDNTSHTVEMVSYYLPAFYQYYAVPRIDAGAFLIAHMVDWEKYNLLEGEASVFFENTYVGKSLMDVRFAGDTLELSLGRDKGITINREKTQDLTSRRFLSTRKVESRGWETTVRNNKSQQVSLVVLDQVPVSAHSDIEVTVDERSGATHTKATGEIRWEVTLEPNERKTLNLQYSVRYPRDKNLIIE